MLRCQPSNNSLDAFASRPGGFRYKEEVRPGGNPDCCYLVGICKYRVLRRGFKGFLNAL
jgi:hypothetical protein